MLRQPGVHRMASCARDVFGMTLHHAAPGIEVAGQVRDFHGICATSMMIGKLN